VTREEFDALVAPLEELARRSPGVYRRQVVAFALLGYAFLFGSLLVIVALLALLVVVLSSAGGGYVVAKLAIPLVVLGWMVVRSLWVTFPAPDGIPLTASETPKLFEMLDAVRTSAGSPRFHAVILDENFNAGVSEVPRLGVFGWPRHYLVLGYPLLHALTPVQLRAVVAHELGHRSGRHGRIGGWIYRVRMTWLQLLERLERNRRAGAFVFQGFFQWYAPKFQAYSFVLARAQEYEADRLAAEITSPADVAAALTAIAVRGRFLETEWWPGVKRRVPSEPAPPRDLFLALGREIGATIPGPEAAPLLEAELARETDTTDTHPSLPDRLRALGVSPPALEPLPALTETAAHAFLGDTASPLGASLSEQWRTEIESVWHEKHDEAVRRRRRAEELATRAAADALSDDEQEEQALLAWELEGLPAARALLERAALARPDRARIRFWLGRALAQTGDPGAAAHLEYAARSDPLLAQEAYARLERLAEESGDREGATQWHERLLAHREMLDRAGAERGQIGPEDELEGHGLEQARLEPLCRHLASIPEVRRAWLFRKRVRLLPELPFFGLLAEVRTGLFTLNKAALANALIQRIARHPSVPDPTWITVAWSRSYPLAKRLRSMGATAEIYRRGS